MHAFASFSLVLQHHDESLDLALKELFAETLTSYEQLTVVYVLRSNVKRSVNNLGEGSGVLGAVVYLCGIVLLGLCIEAGCLGLIRYYGVILGLVVIVVLLAYDASLELVKLDLALV